jgi:phosphoribosylformimino-5-aminoimidazole carboxamide ribotide isomerase
MQNFEIIPAIDLKNGKCVRLIQGKVSKKKVYSANPVEMAKKWEAEGARRLHIVDLDGAFSGSAMHTDIIKQIIEGISIPVQVGGGLRINGQIKTILDYGANKAIIGTAACESLDKLKDLAEEFGEKLAVAIDARDGYVRVKGWQKLTKLQPAAFARQVSEAGINTIIYTDITSDGMQTGPDMSGIKQVCENTSCNIIASGGISTLEDIQKLRMLSNCGVVGAIVGKALYEGKVFLSQLQNAAYG